MRNQSPRDSRPSDSPSRDEVLKRMLKMKPKPHKERPAVNWKKAAKKVRKTAINKSV